MKSESMTGSVAALVMAFCYVFGFVMLLTAMNPGSTEGWGAVEKLAFVLERQRLFQLWNTVIYVIFGIALVVLSVVLHRLMGRPSSLVMSLATPFGLIWSGLVIASGMVTSVGLSAVADVYAHRRDEAAEAWFIIGAIQDGLGGGVEVVGGIWVLLISVASLKSGALLPKWLNWIGLVVGLAGLATLVPALGMLGAVFGLVQIVWFLGLGVVLLRPRPVRREQIQ